MSGLMRYLKQGLQKHKGPNLYDIVLSETIDLIKKEVETIDTIDGHSSLIGDLDLDSVELMELIETFEDKFNVEIAIDRLPELKTVEDLVRLIYPLIQEKHM